MAESLGQKLREAREEKDISISEVAEQTRISALYLESIENDDYRSLPGGIFNKGFVKSFAKYVGVDEHEALEDYARLMASTSAEADDEGRSDYKPQVLTDDSGGGSMLPNIIIAVLILGLMAWGVFALVKYVQSTESASAGNSSLDQANMKTPEPTGDSNTSTNTSKETFKTDSIELKISNSGTDPVSISSTADGKLETVELNSEITERVVEAEESVKLQYYKGAAEFVQLELNGKKLKSPIPPEGYRRMGLIYEINLENIEQILKSGEIALDGVPKPAGQNTNTANNSVGGANTGSTANANTANAQ